MSIVTFASNSPYFSTTQSSWHINRFVFRPVPPDPGDTYVTLLLTHEYRPDRLSFDLYNTPAYWWVFCVRNPFLRGDPIWGFLNGLTIITPCVSYLNSIM